MDEDSVCRCEIVGFGEIRASTIGASEHDEWYNVSINYKDGEGLFYTLFTYKEPPSSFILTILKKPVFNKLLALKLFSFSFPHIYIYIYSFIHKKYNNLEFDVLTCFFLLRDGSHKKDGYCLNIWG